MKKNLNYWTRKSHRYLGLFIGIQFLFWTLGGLYFSWSDLDKIHGDHLKKHPENIAISGLKLVSPQQVIDKVVSTYGVEEIRSLQLIHILGKPVYKVNYIMKHGGHDMVHYQLADANTGELRGALSEEEAVKMAEEAFIPDGAVKEVIYLTETDNHHEYRGRALPVWAVTFDHPSRPTIYVDAQAGQVSSIRHDDWRVFDFLWMLHTMDYQGRDNFGNILLKAFSILGLVTITSGFMLFYFTSSTLRKKKKPVEVKAKVSA